MKLFKKQKGAIFGIGAAMIYVLIAFGLVAGAGIILVFGTPAVAISNLIEQAEQRRIHQDAVNDTGNLIKFGAKLKKK
jgi:hypothetical protein